MSFFRGIILTHTLMLQTSKPRKHICHGFLFISGYIYWILISSKDQMIYFDHVLIYKTFTIYCTLFFYITFSIDVQSCGRHSLVWLLHACTIISSKETCLLLFNISTFSITFNSPKSFSCLLLQWFLHSKHLPFFPRLRILSPRPAWIGTQHPVRGKKERQQREVMEHSSTYAVGAIALWNFSHFSTVSHVNDKDCNCISTQ